MMKKLISLMAAVLFLLCPPAPCAAEEAGERMISTTFRALMSPKLTYETVYDESVFMKDPGTYDHTLARMSPAMAPAAFRPESPEDDRSANIVRFLTDAGMSDVRTDRYGTGMSADTIGTAMGMKTVGSGKNAFRPVAVAVCGGRYGNEWLGNFKVGNPGDSTELLHHRGPSRRPGRSSSG